MTFTCPNAFQSECIKPGIFLFFDPLQMNQSMHLLCYMGAYEKQMPLYVWEIMQLRSSSGTLRPCILQTVVKEWWNCISCFHTEKQQDICPSSYIQPGLYSSTLTLIIIALCPLHIPPSKQRSLRLVLFHSTPRKTPLPISRGYFYLPHHLMLPNIFNHFLYMVISQ